MVSGKAGVLLACVSRAARGRVVSCRNERVASPAIFGRRAVGARRLFVASVQSIDPEWGVKSTNRSPRCTSPTERPLANRNPNDQTRSPQMKRMARAPDAPIRYDATISRKAVPYSTVYRTVQYGTGPYSTVPYSPVRYRTVRYGAVQYGPVHSTVRYIIRRCPPGTRRSRAAATART